LLHFWTVRRHKSHTFHCQLANFQPITIIRTPLLLGFGAQVNTSLHTHSSSIHSYPASHPPCLLCKLFWISGSGVLYHIYAYTSEFPVFPPSVLKSKKIAKNCHFAGTKSKFPTWNKLTTTVVLVSIDMCPWAMPGG
jgi:hypothetical protein